MKTFTKSIAALLILLTINLITINPSTAQTPPPPNGGSNPGSNNTPVGGGAPIGSGLGILLILGATYGGRKVYKLTHSGSKMEDPDCH